MFYILNQSKDKIIPCDYGVKLNSNRISHNDYIIGTYKSEARAREVFLDIFNNLKFNCGRTKFENMIRSSGYEMPIE